MCFYVATEPVITGLRSCANVKPRMSRSISMSGFMHSDWHGCAVQVGVAAQSFGIAAR